MSSQPAEPELPNWKPDAETPTFQREYLGRLCEPPHAADLRRMAMEYVERTELYDAQVCHHFLDNGIAMPVTVSECAACNRHAIELKRHLFGRLQYHVDHREWQRAVNEAQQIYIDGLKHRRG